MHEGGLLGTYEIRSETGNAGTGMYRRGADEHGCEFAPVASRNQTQYRNSYVPLQIPVRIRFRRTDGVSSQSSGKTIYYQKKHFQER